MMNRDDTTLVVNFDVYLLTYFSTVVIKTKVPTYSLNSLLSRYYFHVIVNLENLDSSNVYT